MGLGRIGFRWASDTASDTDTLELSGPILLALKEFEPLALLRDRVESINQCVENSVFVGPCSLGCRFARF